MSSNQKDSERRIHERITDRSFLLVQGKDLQGLPFQATTQVNDLSPEGVSFFLELEILPAQLLELTVGEYEESSRQFASTYAVQARVINVIPARARENHFRVGTRFEGEVKELKNAFNPEVFAQELRAAFEKDEQRRQLN
jgi:hypothetical protein